MAGKLGERWLTPEMLGLNDPDHEKNLRDVCQALTDAGLWLGPRRALEEDPSFRQIIPYIMLRNDFRYLTYTRGSEIEEERLRGMVALGFGGHIDLPDVVSRRNEIDLFETVMVGAEREIMEEVGMIVSLSQAQFGGLLVDHKSEVSRVHIGLILIIDTIATVESKEDSQTNLKWMTLEELADIPEGKQEGWTSVIVEHVQKSLPKPNVD